MDRNEMKIVQAFEALDDKIDVARRAGIGSRMPG
jgi:hypothetical protein